MEFKGLAISLIMGLMCLSSSAEDFSETGGGISYGLSFKSYETTQDERTSLDLTPGYSIGAEKGFSVEFDLRIRHGFSFGYIFRFIDDRLNHLDLCSNHDATRFSFIYGNNEDVISNGEVMVSDGCTGHHVRVEMASGSDCFVCSVDSVSVDVPVNGSRPGKFNLFFGCIDSDRYFTTDIPHFTLKDVVIMNWSGKTVAHWPMSRHGVGVVYDVLNHKKANVRNAYWEIDSHSKWKRCCVMNYPASNVGVSCSTDGSEIFIVSEDSLTVYFTEDGHTEERRVVGGRMPDIEGCGLIYDGPDAILMAASKDLPGVQLYNLTENEWASKGSGQILPVTNHPGLYFEDSTRTAFLVGGYGMHRYFNELHSFCFGADREWKSSKIDMTPRYLCAVGEYDGSLLVVGGYGSRSGLQEEDPHNLYDILSVDIATAECDTLSNILRSKDDPQFVFSSSMVVDSTDNCFYSLIFNNERFNSEVQLAKVDVNTGAMERYADPLPFKYHDLSSYCHIFRGGRSGESLYAVLTQPQGDNGYEVSIYSMSYPPLHVSDIMLKERNFREKVPLLALVFICLCAAAYVLLLVMPGRKRDDKANALPVSSPLSVDRSFIRLLGGFQVLDSKGNDITGDFSPILRGVLSFIILRYGKDGKGVGNATLDNAFWPYMEHPKALNNRRVNLSKLRSILMKVGDVRIDSREGYVDFILGDDVFCDYLELDKALRSFNVDSVASIGSLGSLLPDLSYNCLSEFKNDLTLRLSDFLLHLGGGKDRDALKMRVRIADIILQSDALDENAINVKCYALYVLGQKGLSRAVYDSFAAQYKSFLGTEPDFSYSDILKSKGTLSS